MPILISETEASTVNEKPVSATMDVRHCRKHLPPAVTLVSWNHSGLRHAAADISGWHEYKESAQIVWTANVAVIRQLSL